MLFDIIIMVLRKNNKHYSTFVITVTFVNCEVFCRNKLNASIHQATYILRRKMYVACCSAIPGRQQFHI